MRPTFKILIFCILFSMPLLCKAQHMDFKPLDAYWDLIEPLKKGDSLSHETWKEFLDIEANHIYVENQGFNADYLERLRKTMEYVYMPKNDSLLKVRIAAIEKDPASYWLTYKVYVYKKYEQELKAYEKKLQDPSYLDAMYDQTFGWLPKNLQKKDANTQFYLLGFENDAIAGGGVIIATLWDLYNQDRINFGSTAGHEMHHNLRKPIDFKNVAETDLGVLYFLNSVLNEGTADMIDKPANIALEAQLPNELRLKDFLLFQADSIVSVVDADITQMAASHGTVYQSEKDYRNLLRWTSGHCPGFYMADIIVRNGFKKKLIQNIRNPFAFIYLYNKAAKKDAEKPTLFSDTSIAYIKELETKYWVPLKLK